MKLHSVNTEDVMNTRLTSVSRVALFSAFPLLDPEAGHSFDFVPDEPGVICWFNEDGSLESIDVANSMRQRLVDIYKGTAGDGRKTRGMIFGYEPSSDAKLLRKAIIEDHVRHYERFPAARTA